MTAAMFPAPRPVTLSPSMSIYVPASKTASIWLAAEVGDAVTVSGQKGPGEIRKLRSQGFTKPVLFDAMGYASDRPPEPGAWARLQAAAGADRLLLPGAYLDWDPVSMADLETLVREQSALAKAHDATALVALDARWLTKRERDLTDALASMDCPVALVLAAKADPLATGRAVEGLRWLCARVRNLSLLRSDHGAIGAVASGAVHAAIGLNPSNRHFVPPGESAFAKASTSARVFVPSLVDWFLAEAVASWNAAAVPLRCDLDCCRGESIARYFDPDLNADWHNMCALSDFADQVLNAERPDQAREFINRCQNAAGLYDVAGMHGPGKAKAQLSAWALA